MNLRVPWRLTESLVQPVLAFVVTFRVRPPDALINGHEIVRSYETLKPIMFLYEPELSEKLQFFAM